jgi:hypothetical protein
MTDKNSEKPKDNQPETSKSQSPKAAKADNDVVKVQPANKDVVHKEIVDGADAPKDSKKSSKQAATTYDLGTFLHLSSLAHDQLYAFKVWATAEKLGKLSKDDWQKRLQDFLDRPV